MKNLEKKILARKIVAVATALAFIVIGILLCIPGVTGMAFEAVCAMLLILMGFGAVYAIAKYITSKSKNGWLLAEGIMFGILFVLVVIAISVNGQAAFENYTFMMFTIITTFVGFIAIMGGIMRISTANQSNHPTYFVIYGIIQLIIGSVLAFGVWFCFNLEDLFIIACFLGAYAIVAGLNLLLLTLANGDRTKDENVIDIDVDKKD